MEHKSTGWLSEKEVAQVEPADKLGFGSPIPTQIVSNGEYNPLPQTEKQRQVEGLIKEFADKYGKHQGMDRRTFLRTASGMAAAFLAMNQVFGPVWNVSEAEAADKDLANERAKRLSTQFIFDDQTHFVRDDFDKEGILGLGKYASEHWNPKMLDKMPLVLQRYKFENYLKEIYLDSDTKVALLSGAPFDDPSWWLLSNDQIFEARQAINKVAGGPPPVQPLRVHAPLRRLGRRGRSRRGRVEPRRLEGLHRGRPAVPSRPRRPCGGWTTRS